MAETAQDIFDVYFDLMEHTESPYIYHRWCLISGVGTLLGRQVYLPFGSKNIYPNQYICLIGTPGSRKGSAIDPLAEMIEESGYEHFAGDRSSKGQFLIDWEYGFDRISRGEDEDNGMGLDDELFGASGEDEVKEAFICAEELQDFLGNGNSDFISMLTKVWNILPKYTDRLKNSKSVWINKPIINLLGGATPTTFTSMFSKGVLGQGMLSRLILIYGEGARQKITIPPPLDPELRSQLILYLRKIRTELHGECTLSKAAYTAVDYIYHNYADLEDGRLADYNNRRFIHLLKLSIIIAVMDLRLEIQEDDVIKANTILGYTETFMPKALGEFGKSKTAETAHSVMSMIDAAPGGLTIHTIWKSVNTELDCLEDLAKILQKLTTSDKIKLIKPGDRFVATEKLIRKENKYFDLNVLREWKDQSPQKVAPTIQEMVGESR